jgi:hypothetical protein
MFIKTIQGHGCLYDIENGKLISNAIYKIWWQKPSTHVKGRWHGVLFEVEKPENIEKLFFNGILKFLLKLEDGHTGRITFRGVGTVTIPTYRFRGSGSLE